jgi:MYXO-CTERM domain-containing protein
MKRLAIASLLSALGADLSVGAAMIPQTVSACGGLFCDGGPQPMPVDQTGEDVLFVLGDGTIEVHIRVLYEGEAAKFAWVIPVQSLPEFSVGSETLFENIKNATVPTYGFTTQRDDCSVPTPGSDDANSGTGAASSGGGDGGTDGGQDPGGPTIFAQETVGAFEITVLGEGSAEEIVQWLDENGYQQDPEALPIIGEYLAENHMFAAIKLTGGADVDEIHPIALSFNHTEPCVPLRLTRIAAQDDMDVRVYFLSDGRVVPRSYRHVLVNPLKIDWSTQAANYKDVITRAVDAPEADGRAFVTEYAGPSTVVAEFGVYSESWDATPFRTIPVTSVVDELTAQSLYACDFDFGLGCAGIHPMVDALLAEFLPVPAGLEADQFYSDLASYEGMIDAEVWNPEAFADKMQARIIDPGANASELLRRNPYMTRMYTTISPHEMITDPMFHENKELEDVPNLRNATQRILCNGDAVWILPDGREVYLPAGATWPDIGGEEYWEEEVQETPAAGAPMVLVDNHEAIDTVLAAYNAEQGWAGGPGDGSGGGPGGIDDGSGGCGCSVTDPFESALGFMALTVGFGVALRRRRR